MEKYLAIAILAGALGAAGCAATDPQASAAADPKATAAPKTANSNDLLTGSRIPRKALGEQPVSQISSDEIRRSSSPDIYIPPK